MDWIDQLGSSVMETLAERDRLEEFAMAVDHDDTNAARTILMSAGISTDDVRAIIRAMDELEA